MNDLVRPDEIIRALFHRHKPKVTREYRHPKFRGLVVQHRVCRTCGKPLKMKVRAI